MRSAFTKIARSPGKKNSAAHFSRLTLHVDQRIAETGVLYRWSKAGTSWMPIDADTRRRDAIGHANQELQTFEFEFSRHESEFGKRDRKWGE